MSRTERLTPPATPLQPGRTGDQLLLFAAALAATVTGLCDRLVRLLVVRLRPAEDRRRCGDDRGQATVEYALVILAAAAVALLLIAWAARSGKIGELMDRVFDSVVGRVA